MTRESVTLNYYRHVAWQRSELKITLRERAISGNKVGSNPTLPFFLNKSMKMLGKEPMKDNYHRDLHNAVTQGTMSPEDYSRKMEKHNREAILKMLRQRMKLLKKAPKT